MGDAIQEPARSIPVAADVDVLVAGAGRRASLLPCPPPGRRAHDARRALWLPGRHDHRAYVVAIIGGGDGHVPVVRGITTEIRERMERFGPSGAQ